MFIALHPAMGEMEYLMPVGRACLGRTAQGGFVWYFALFILATSAIGVLALGANWLDVSHREREKELIRVGDLYVSALRSYVNSTSSPVPLYPNNLSDLLEDRRSELLRRHLRRLLPDPITGQHDWILIRNAQGGIIGLHSKSTRMPLLRTVLRTECCLLPVSQQYSDWKFIVGGVS